MIVGLRRDFFVPTDLSEMLCARRSRAFSARISGIAWACAARTADELLNDTRSRRADVTRSEREGGGGGGGVGGRSDGARILDELTRHARVARVRRLRSRRN